MTEDPMRRLGIATVCVALLLLGGGVATGQSDPASSTTATPKAQCGPGSHPESGLQGRVSATDVSSGRAAQGFSCNTQLVSHVGTRGGFKVERYIDKAGHECAYFDTTLLFPINVLGGDHPTGVWVVDMSDPAHPVHTDSLQTPAMLSPHESVVLSEQRGLLAAVMGNPALGPGVVDVYDVTGDCRHPVLKSTSPTGFLGHESGFVPDGKTFYATSLFNGSVTAVDVSDPTVPKPLWIGNYPTHGMSLSDDGNRAYMAARSNAGPQNQAGLIILDVSSIQRRDPNPQPTVVATLTWPTVSIPQNAIPVRIGGHPYLVEIDEYAGSPIPSNSPSAVPGAGRIIDIADEKHPKVVSNLRLEVHDPANRTSFNGDPGFGNPAQGYAGHYCNVPSRTDPGIVACSMISSGLRVFDIRDPLHPKEIAYYNAPPAQGAFSSDASDFAMSSPAFAPERGEVWYTDGNSGLYILHLTNGVWPFTAPASGPAAAAPARPASSPARPSGVQPSSASRPSDDALPATGGRLPLAPGIGVLALGLALATSRRRRRIPARR